VCWHCLYPVVNLGARGSFPLREWPFAHRGLILPRVRPGVNPDFELGSKFLALSGTSPDPGLLRLGRLGTRRFPGPHPPFPGGSRMLSDPSASVNTHLRRFLPGLVAA
jgi:hypothetical protein